MNGDEVIVHRAGKVAAFRLDDGTPTWSTDAASTGVSTPIVDGRTVYVATWNNFGEEALRVNQPPFTEILEKHDQDGDGTISKQELPWSVAVSTRPEVERGAGGNIAVKMFFGMVDSNQDMHIDDAEWGRLKTFTAQMTEKSEHGLMAITLEGEGDVSAANVLWKHTRNVPEVPSPLFVNGRIYIVKNGGIFTCLSADDGNVVYQKRLGPAAAYYASPVTGDGKIYTASGKGIIVVLPAGDAYQRLAVNDLKEPIYATPAIVGDTILVRTEQHLYAFRLGGKSTASVTRD